MYVNPAFDGRDRITGGMAYAQSSTELHMAGSFPNSSFTHKCYPISIFSLSFPNTNFVVSKLESSSMCRLFDFKL